MKKGVDAKIVISISGDLSIAGFATWKYSGNTRGVLTQTEFGASHVEKEGSILEGGTVEMTGFYKLDSDAGQILLKDVFDNNTHLAPDEIRFYMDDTHYLTPSAVSTPESYCIITKFNDTGQDVSGVGTFACTMMVSGQLVPGID